MRYIKTVSLLTMIMVGMSGVSYGAPMTSQIRRLMQEKEEKIKALEQCDGKRKGWMIAGISTIGLTAVGVGVNIAQTSKSNRLSGEIDSAKQELDKQEYTLQNINYEISEKERKKAELERQRKEADCEAREGMWWNPSTERCEPKLTSPAGSTGANILPAPVLDNHPKLGDSCQDGGAWIWTEVTGADVPDDAPTCIKEPAGTTSCVCAPKKLELMDALGAKSGGTLSKGDAKLAASSVNNSGTGRTAVTRSFAGFKDKYAGYKISCDNDKDVFDFLSGDDRAEETMTRIEADCTKYNGSIRYQRHTVTVSGDGESVEETETIISCVGAKGCGQNNVATSEVNADVTLPKNPDWYILEKADRSYGITKEYFCRYVQGHKYIAYTIDVHASYDKSRLSALIEQGAGMGYWCKLLGGRWEVVKPDFMVGRTWTCYNSNTIMEQCGFAQSAPTEIETEESDLITTPSYRDFSDKEKCKGSGGTFWDGLQCWCPLLGHMRQSADKKTCECKDEYVPDSDGNCIAIEKIVQEEQRRESAQYMQELNQEFTERYMYPK